MGNMTTATTADTNGRRGATPRRGEVRRVAAPHHQYPNMMTALLEDLLPRSCAAAACHDHIELLAALRKKLASNALRGAERRSTISRYDLIHDRMSTILHQRPDQFIGEHRTDD
jgi:hypothetical protein